MLEHTKIFFSTFNFIAHITRDAFSSAQQLKLPKGFLINILKSTISQNYTIEKLKIKKPTIVYSEEQNLCIEILFDGKVNFLISRIIPLNIHNNRILRSIDVDHKEIEDPLFLKSNFEGIELFINKHIPQLLKMYHIDYRYLLIKKENYNCGLYRELVEKPLTFVLEYTIDSNKIIITHLFKPDILKFGFTSVQNTIPSNRIM